MDVDTEFLEALPTDGLVKRLARLNMPADEAPAVGGTTGAMDGDAPGARDRRARVRRLRSKSG